MVSKVKINPVAPDSLQGRQAAERMRQRNEAEAGQQGQTGASMQQEQHAGAQESATGPAGKRQTDEARPKLSRK